MESRLENTLDQDKWQRINSLHDQSVLFGAFDREQPNSTRSSRALGNSSMTIPSWSGQEEFVDNPVATSSSVLPQFQGNSALASDMILMRQSPLSLTTMDPSPTGKTRGPLFHELPTKPAALELVKDSFRSFYRFFPLFDEQEFLQQFRNHYTGACPSDPSWWACINVVLSLAHRFRAMRTGDPTYENAQSSGYIHNALAVVSELNMLHQSLPAVQALVGIAIALQASPNPHAASVLIAAAMRLAQAMGLHRKTEKPGLTEAQIEQRRRVFWIAYFLDKDISLRMGQPFAQDDEDMDTELPTGTRFELSLCSDGPRTINFFNSRIGLAVIQGQIYKRLYSVQATRQSAAQKAAVAQELMRILSYWKSGVPVDFEYDLVGPKQTPLTAEFLHMLILRFTYVQCLVMIDRHLPPMEQLPVDAALETQSAYTFSESLCIVESRKAIRLIQMTPHGDYACVW